MLDIYIIYFPNDLSTLKVFPIIIEIPQKKEKPSTIFQFLKKRKERKKEREIKNDLEKLKQEFELLHPKNTKIETACAYTKLNAFIGKINSQGKQTQYHIVKYVNNVYFQQVFLGILDINEIKNKNPYIS